MNPFGQKHPTYYTVNKMMYCSDNIRQVYDLMTKIIPRICVPKSYNNDNILCPAAKNSSNELCMQVAIKTVCNFYFLVMSQFYHSIFNIPQFVYISCS